MSDNATPHGSAGYDAEIVKTIPLYGRFHEETIDLVRAIVPEVSVWLDTGCGTGYLVEQASPVFTETRFLLADPAAAMLDLARSRLSSLAPGRISLLGALKTEQLLDQAFETPDVITAIQSHHYGPEEARKEATSVCFQLLKTGGLYITFENIRPDTAQGTQIGLDRWCAFQRRAGRPDQAVDEHRARFGKNYFPITVPEHLALLKASGFKTVELFWLSYMQAGIYAIK